jgi:hypothetical protein
MIAWSKRRTWVAGLAIIVLSNAVALAGVAWNRSGEPEAVVTVTERELEMPYRSRFERENSGISLRLDWRTRPDEIGQYIKRGSRSRPHWLDRDKLRELGFNIDELKDSWEARRRFNRTLSREVYVVLEYDGPAWREIRDMVGSYHDKAKALAANNPDEHKLAKDAERAVDRRRLEQHGASRLIAVDAGLDAASLRARYPERGRYIISATQVRPNVSRNKDKTWEIRGTITQLAVGRVHVDASYRHFFESLAKEAIKPDQRPRYRVKLAWGRRLEPWVVAIEPIRTPDTGRGRR